VRWRIKDQLIRRALGEILFRKLSSWQVGGFQPLVLHPKLDTIGNRNVVSCIHIQLLNIFSDKLAAVSCWFLSEAAIGIEPMNKGFTLSARPPFSKRAVWLGATF